MELKIIEIRIECECLENDKLTKRSMAQDEEDVVKEKVTAGMSDREVCCANPK